MVSANELTIDLWKYIVPWQHRTFLLSWICMLMLDTKIAPLSKWYNFRDGTKAAKISHHSLSVRRALWVPNQKRIVGDKVLYRTSWLRELLETKLYLYMPTAWELCASLANIYSEKGHKAQIYSLQCQIQRTKQKNLSVLPIIIHFGGLRKNSTSLGVINWSKILGRKPRIYSS